MKSAGIRAVSTAFPSLVRTNDHWRTRHPDMVALAEQKSLARSFAPVLPSSNTRLFDLEMEPYLADPFRGAVERRVLAPGETALGLEARAIRDALTAAGLTPKDVDLTIVGSLLSDRVFPGDAAYLCKELGLGGTAFNLESACTTTLQGLHIARTMVGTGQYRNALVVGSCTYSRYADVRDTLAWFLADGAGAFLVTEAPAGEGFLGFESHHTADTCDAFQVELSDDPALPRIWMHAGAHTSKQLREQGHVSVRECCLGAAKAAGVELRDIDFFVFNTPLPFYHRMCARALEVDVERTVNYYDRYANIGPALLPVNLHHAAQAGKIQRGDLVMLYTIGSASSAGAAVMRWGDVSLGPMPAPSSSLPRG